VFDTDDWYYLAEVGKRISVLRDDVNLSHFELASKAEINLRVLKQIEAGRHAGNVLTYRKLATALGTRIEVLLYEPPL
jgi:ribosome-binding protein aMBF1 (putative translation factor)